MASLPSSAAALSHDANHALATADRTFAVMSLSSPLPAKISRATHHLAPISACLILDERRAVLASQLITLHALPSGNLITRYTGHASPVVAIARASPNSFVTAASDDRHLFVWPVSTRVAPGRKCKRVSPATAPIATLSLPENGALQVAATDESGAQHVAAIMRSGSVAVWRDVPPTTTAALACTFIVRPSSSADVFTSIFSGQTNLTIFHGHSLNPDLFTVDLSSVEEKELSLPQVGHALVVKNQISKQQAKADFVQKTIDLESSNVAVASAVSKRERSDEDQDGKEDTDDEMDEDEQPTIQEKLAALGVTPGTKASTRPSIPTLESTRLDSRVVLLCQAVRSRDEQLFDRVIDSTQDLTTIRNTVDELPAEIATKAVLGLLVERLERYPRRTQKLLPWIRTIVIEHAGTFISEQKNETLHMLTSIIEARTQNLEALSRLEGRLELVVGQARRLKRLKETSIALAVPEYEYEFGEPKKDREVEDEDDRSSSDDSESSSSDDAERTGVMDEESEESESSEDEVDAMEEEASRNGSARDGDRRRISGMNGTKDNSSSREDRSMESDEISESDCD